MGSTRRFRSQQAGGLLRRSPGNFPKETCLKISKHQKKKTKHRRPCTRTSPPSRLLRSAQKHNQIPSPGRKKFPKSNRKTMRILRRFLGPLTYDPIFEHQEQLKPDPFTSVTGPPLSEPIPSVTNCPVVCVIFSGKVVGHWSSSSQPFQTSSTGSTRNPHEVNTVDRRPHHPTLRTTQNRPRSPPSLPPLSEQVPGVTNCRRWCVALSGEVISQWRNKASNPQYSPAGFFHP
ncbi:unnamed protein product [Cuscuta europaea]|uniref:Uncharacterized protein n=1 Tax=Cuscuta europaea TaxID=41803 RepID=A0A9P0Z819_CUSEU|nr:unnamed protein product [Cuscuta europaea]